VGGNFSPRILSGEIKKNGSRFQGSVLLVVGQDLNNRLFGFRNDLGNGIRSGCTK
jgi:hypothetical protein